MPDRSKKEAGSDLSRFAIYGAQSQMPYQARLHRYVLMVAMRTGIPPHDHKYSLAEIADSLAELGYERLSRERVRQLLVAPPSEKPVSPPPRRADLLRRIRRWEARATDLGEARAETYRRQLESLSPTDGHEERT
jgi:hypothetical protein